MYHCHSKHHIYVRNSGFVNTCSITLNCLSFLGARVREVGFKRKCLIDSLALRLSNPKLQMISLWPKTFSPKTFPITWTFLQVFFLQCHLSQCQTQSAECLGLSLRWSGKKRLYTLSFVLHLWLKNKSSMNKNVHSYLLYSSSLSW
jgi:hypothetical protein